MCNSYLNRSCWQIGPLMINRRTSPLWSPGGSRPQGPDFLCRPLIGNTAQVKQINMLLATHRNLPLSSLPLVFSYRKWMAWTECFSDPVTLWTLKLDMALVSLKKGPVQRILLHFSRDDRHWFTVKKSCINIHGGTTFSCRNGNSNIRIS